MKNYRRNRNSRDALPKKGQRGQRSLFKRWTTSNPRCISLFRSWNTFWIRSNNDFTNCLINSRIFHFLNFTSFFELAYLRFSFRRSPKIVWPLWAPKKGTLWAVKRWISVLLAAQDRKIESCPVNSRRGRVVAGCFFGQIRSKTPTFSNFWSVNLYFSKPFE